MSSFPPTIRLTIAGRHYTLDCVYSYRSNQCYCVTEEEQAVVPIDPHAPIDVVTMQLLMSATVEIGTQAYRFDRVHRNKPPRSHLLPPDFDLGWQQGASSIRLSLLNREHDMVIQRVSCVY